MADAMTRVVSESSELEGTSISPATIASNFTDAIDISRGRRHVAEIFVPTLSGGATVDFGIYGSATSGGTFVSLGNSTQGWAIVTESTGGKVFQLEFTTDAVYNVNSVYKWVKGYSQCKVASAGNVSVGIRSYVLRFLPGSDQASAAQAGVFPSLV